MIFSSFALLSGIALFSSAVTAVTHEIIVGNGLKFDPSYITAAAGDTVSFTFTSNNYTVTQSSFGAPCTPQAGGLDTGFVNSANGNSNTNLPAWQFNVTGTDPIWIHCRQASNTAASHCGQGMVFAVNPGSDGSNESFAAFKAAALAVGAQLASPAANATTPQPSNSTGSLSGGLSTSTSTSKSNGAISLNIDAAMLMAAFGTVVTLMA